LQPAKLLKCLFNPAQATMTMHNTRPPLCFTAASKRSNSPQRFCNVVMMLLTTPKQGQALQATQLVPADLKLTPDMMTDARNMGMQMHPRLAYANMPTM
jgi:hypothetical protein